MSAYIIATVEVTNLERYKEYLRVTPRVVEKFGGRFIARDGEKVTLEGPEETRRVVLVEFPSLQKAKQFYNSKEYQQAKKLRDGAGIPLLMMATGGFLLYALITFRGGITGAFRTCRRNRVIKVLDLCSTMYYSMSRVLL